MLFAIRALAAPIAVAFVFASWDRASASPATEHVDDILDHIDSTSFIEDVTQPVVGSPSGVKQFALGTLEVQRLLEYPDVSISRMLKRLQNPRQIRHDSVLLVYFIVFEKVKDTRTIPYLASYLDSLPSEKESSILYESEPVRYAFDASRVFVALPEEFGCYDSLFHQRHKLARLLLAEYEHLRPAPASARR